MTVAKLTIGHLADHVGLTPRAIRFYHARGLLPEPARDDSGYRRYDAKAVIELIRIKALTDAGVPLARIRELLHATPDEFANAIRSIDDNLREKVQQFEEHRCRLAGLVHGERLFLPEEIVELLDELRAMGVSERTVTIERDGWIVAFAISPDLTRRWVEQKRTALTEPEFRALYVECDRAFDWDPDDPRLAPLANRMAAWSTENPQVPSADEEASNFSAVVGLMTADVEAASAAWTRLGRMVPDRAADA
jgi:DNA-binding transcriptional MerR regulator